MTARQAPATLPLSALVSPPEVRERFVRAVLERLPSASIAEAHLFAPIRQGGVETGIAVLAVEEDAPDDAEPPADAIPDEGAAAPDEHESAPPHRRYAVYTATYRLVVKGPDRGRWEVSVVAEADAPLVTVDAVVRGVQRRAGDEAEVERMSGETLRALVPDDETSSTTSRSST